MRILTGADLNFPNSIINYLLDLNGLTNSIRFVPVLLFASRNQRHRVRLLEQLGDIDFQKWHGPVEVAGLETQAEEGAVQIGQLAGVAAAESQNRGLEQRNGPKGQIAPQHEVGNVLEEPIDCGWRRIRVNLWEII